MPQISAWRMPSRLPDGLRRARVLRRQRQIDDEDASFARHFADQDVAAMSPDGLSRDREPEAEAGPVLPAPVAERLELVARTVRNSRAFVFNLDDHPDAVRPRPQHDVAARRPV